MSQEISNHYELYLDEPRLRMTIAGRSLVRIVSGVAYLVLVVAAITFLLSYDIRALFYLGLFLTLIIADLLIHKGRGDMPISVLPKEGRKNLASVISPSAFLCIERAMDASIITKKSFLLELTDALIAIPGIENGLRRLDVKPEEFRQKLEALMAESVASSTEDNIRQTQLLVTYAFSDAVNADHNFIQTSDIFSALSKMKDEALDRLFALFNIERGDLEDAFLFDLSRGRSARLRESQKDFKKLFEPIVTSQVTDAEAQKVLIHDSVMLEKKLGITISFGAIKRCIVIAKNYGHDQSLLLSTKELLMEALAEAERRGEKVLTADRVAEAAEEKSGTI